MMENQTSFSELRRKEVINICDGARLGHVCDIMLNLCEGCIHALIVPGACKLFGLLRESEPIIIPIKQIKKIGEDVILVEIASLL